MFERIKKLKQREKETPAESELRKGKIREQRKMETPAESELRRRKDREHKIQKRKVETPAESELRRGKDLERTTEQRKMETPAESELRKGKIQEQRKMESPAKSELRRRKNCAHTIEQRKMEAPAESELRRRKDLEHTIEQRKMETDKQRKERCQKNKETMRKIRCTNSELKRYLKFRKAVRYGPIFTCTVCEQDMFINNVSIIDDLLKERVKLYSSELFKTVFVKHNFVELNGESNAYICGTFKMHLKQGKLPSMAAANGLRIVPLGEDLQLTELENNLIGKRIMFQKIYQLPKSRMAACKDHLINIPIGSDDVLNTLKSLPRTPQEAGLLEVKLKRKLEYKNTHQQAYIDTQKIYKAIACLKKKGHPEYQMFDDYHVYVQRCSQL
jgi:hypothetical protein